MEAAFKEKTLNVPEGIEYDKWRSILWYYYQGGSLLRQDKDRVLRRLGKDSRTIDPKEMKGLAIFFSFPNGVPCLLHFDEGSRIANTNFYNSLRIDRDNFGPNELDHQHFLEDINNGVRKQWFRWLQALWQREGNNILIQRLFLVSIAWLLTEHGYSELTVREWNSEMCRCRIETILGNEDPVTAFETQVKGVVQNVLDYDGKPGVVLNFDHIAACSISFMEALPEERSGDIVAFARTIIQEVVPLSRGFATTEECAHIQLTDMDQTYRWSSIEMRYVCLFLMSCGMWPKQRHNFKTATLFKIEEDLLRDRMQTLTQGGKLFKGKKKKGKTVASEREIKEFIDRKKKELERFDFNDTQVASIVNIKRQLEFEEDPSSGQLIRSMSPRKRTYQPPSETSISVYGDTVPNKRGRPPDIMKEAMALCGIGEEPIGDLGDFVMGNSVPPPQRDVFFRNAQEELIKTIGEGVDETQRVVYHIIEQMENFCLPLLYHGQKEHDIQKENIDPSYASYPRHAPKNTVPIKVSAMGNCFFEAMSILVFGDCEHATEMRVRSFCRIICILNELLSKNVTSILVNGIEYFQGVEILASQTDKVVDLDEKTEEEKRRALFDIIKNDIKNSNYVGIWHVVAMTQVLSVPIQSLLASEGTRMMAFDRIFKPNQMSDTNDQTDDNTLIILWMGYKSNLINHVVPCLRMKGKTESVKESSPQLEDLELPFSPPNLSIDKDRDETQTTSGNGDETQDPSGAAEQEEYFEDAQRFSDSEDFQQDQKEHDNLSLLEGMGDGSVSISSSLARFAEILGEEKEEGRSKKSSDKGNASSRSTEQDNGSSFQWDDDGSNSNTMVGDDDNDDDDSKGKNYILGKLLSSNQSNQKIRQLSEHVEMTRKELLRSKISEQENLKEKDSVIESMNLEKRKMEDEIKKIREEYEKRERDRENEMEKKFAMLQNVLECEKAKVKRLLDAANKNNEEKKDVDNKESSLMERLTEEKAKNKELELRQSEMEKQLEMLREGLENERAKVKELTESQATKEVADREDQASLERNRVVSMSLIP